MRIRALAPLAMVAGILCVSATANAGLMVAVEESADSLVSIDTNTLAVTTIGSLGTSFAFGGLAYDSGNQVLYMVGGRGNNALYTVDLLTGAATLVGSHGVNDLFGLEFDSSTGTLYGTQFSNGSSLYSLNTTTGAATLIGDMGRGIGGLAYNSATDQLVGSEDGAGDLYSIDRATGALSLLYDGDFVDDSGLAYDPDLNVYWQIDWNGNLYSYDIGNGYARTTLLSGLGSHDGLAYIAGDSVPEPSTWMLSAGGLLALIASRKKLLRRK